MVNKKGEEGWTLITLLIALLVLVVIGAGIYYVYTYASTTSGQYLPSDLQKIAVACEVSAKLGDLGKVDYCTQPKPVNYGSETRYVTCNYKNVKNYITDKTLNGACNDAEDNIAVCTTLRDTLGKNYNPEKVKVNDVVCETILGA
ncbi:MAG: hypothetical protein Q8L29_00840 [archaeon]|nr:hypothetical protein [archaeon]